jgi:hypothetical protein
VSELRQNLHDDGFCRLDGFLFPNAIDRLVAEVEPLESSAYFGLTEATPYFNDPEPDLPDNHPRNIRTPRELGIVAADLIPPESDLFKLYAWDPFKDFLAEILDKSLFRLADPYQTLNITVMPEGEGQNWHFDDPEFVITLMLRKAEWGGDFECVPNIRSPRNENYDEVREVLLGCRDKVRVMKLEPGTLMIFLGRYALHQVSPVRSSIPRLMTIINYATEPDWQGDSHLNKEVYGLRFRTWRR